MRYGFYCPTRGGGATAEAVEAILAKGEALGFTSTMIADHIVFPTRIASRYPYTVSGDFPGGGDALDQLSLLAFAAGRTRALRLVTSVMIVPHRNPVLTAKMLATIDVLSRGRVTVGIGVGWLREEFEALGAADFDRRGAVSDEYIRIFKTLWTQSPASFEGEFYRFAPLKCLPQPLQKPHPPIWIGGHSPAALRRVARLGDGWHPVGGIAAIPLRPPEMRASLDELRRLTEKEGRDFSKLTISFKTPLYDGEIKDPEGRRPFSGGPDQILEDIDAYARLGVSELIFDCRTERLDQSLDRLERFAALVKPPAKLTAMRIATWNVNSLKARLEKVTWWLERARPDVLLMQETKLADDDVPREVFEGAGYEMAHHGEGRWNGVAIASRVGIADVVTNFGEPLRLPKTPDVSDDEPLAEARMISAACGGVRVVSIYAPNGRVVDSPFYRAKLTWYERLARWLAEAGDTSSALAIGGDFNVAPEDADVWDPTACHGGTHVSPPERTAFARLCEWGLVDAYRLHHREPGRFTWWDYRAGNFHKNFGMRIDHLLVTKSLAARVIAAEIDREARKGKPTPSDHTPLVIDVDEPGLPFDAGWSSAEGRIASRRSPGTGR